MVEKAVTFQGECGAYSEMAALQYFPNAKVLPKKTFQDVFDSLETGEANYAVVPIENSIEGSVNETYDLLLQRKITVSGEIYQRVRHCLIVNKGITIGQIAVVYSHPQAIAQCRGYLQLKKIESIPTYDTAGAVKMIKEKIIMNAAAIASRRAAEIYDMDVLEEGIEDRKINFTRFLVLSKTKTKPTGHDRTSIIFSVKHLPGALFSILKEFASREINLTRIESRPTKETPWEYNFYVDFEGHYKDETIKKALQSIKNKSIYFKILGSYKKAELY
ncbi:MAG: prephenate dehydratase [Thermoproteota archaeon]|jgi:prephenate dehydratase|nr:prephenate dehydratase [Thermoproteota archaeon]